MTTRRKISSSYDDREKTKIDLMKTQTEAFERLSKASEGLLNPPKSPFGEFVPQEPLTVDVGKTRLFATRVLNIVATLHDIPVNEAIMILNAAEQAVAAQGNGSYPIYVPRKS